MTIELGKCMLRKGRTGAWSSVVWDRDTKEIRVLWRDEAQMLINFIDTEEMAKGWFADWRKDNQDDADEYRVQ